MVLHFIFYIFFYSYTYGKGVEGSVHVKTSLVGKHRPAVLVDHPEAQQVEFDKLMSRIAFFPLLFSYSRSLLFLLYSVGTSIERNRYL